MAGNIKLAVSQDQNQVNKNRHAAACMICQHTDHLQDIETDYLHWIGYKEIMGRYFPDRDPADANSLVIFRQSLLRHARIFGLEYKRNQNVMSALGTIAERGLDSLNGLKMIAPSVTLDALKELNKLTAEKEEDPTKKKDIPASREDILKELMGALDPNES